MEPEELNDKRLKDVLPPAGESGINSRAILKFCFALIVVAVAVHVLVWWMFNIFDARRKADDPSLSPLVPKQQQLPPEPRLQALPNRAGSPTQLFDSTSVELPVNAEKELLKDYGWVDPQNGIVRIPITEAMKIVVEKEKQLQTQSAPSTQTGATDNDQQ